jgi:hypothetical protein
MTNTLRTVQAIAIDPAYLADVRSSGTDGFGNDLSCQIAEGWEPLRCCLRLAESGEPVAMISYSPHRRPSPWAEIGPVFIHARPCAGFDPRGGLPAELRTGPRILRCYRPEGSMNYEATVLVADGIDIEPTLSELLDRPDVVGVHVRSATAQCFTYAVRAGVA